MGDLIDLRSDTVTRPTEAMRRAMASAEVGDDVYGEDPTVNALEERVAGLLGHEAALFVPTGTMGNQIGMRLVAEPGQEVLCDADAHVVTYEMGAAAAIFGISTRTVVSDRGLLDADALIAQVRPRGCVQVRIVTPPIAPWAPSSARAMCADASQSTSWPGSQTRRMPIWLPIVPEGTNSAASWPNRPATRSSRARTVGSSP